MYKRQAFTIALSITLGLTVFEIISLPQGTMEALIALTIIYLALEIRQERENFRNPWLMAFIFGLLHGLGFSINDGKITEGKDVRDLIQSKMNSIDDAKNNVKLENERNRILDEKRRTARIQAETAARQRGEDIAATELAGKEAQEAIEDPGSDDEESLNNAKIELDENEVMNSLWIVNNVSSLEWIDAAPCRVGCRMGRPEKSAPREMKQKAHALYPIQNYGGPQRLLATAVSREGSIRAVSYTHLTLPTKRIV